MVWSENESGQLSEGGVECDFGPLPLMPGSYTLQVALLNEYRAFHVIREAFRLEVEPSDFLGTGRLPRPEHGSLIFRARFVTTEFNCVSFGPDIVNSLSGEMMQSGCRGPSDPRSSSDQIELIVRFCGRFSGHKEANRRTGLAQFGNKLRCMGFDSITASRYHSPAQSYTDREASVHFVHNFLPNRLTKCIVPDKLRAIVFCVEKGVTMIRCFVALVLSVFSA